MKMVLMRITDTLWAPTESMHQQYSVMKQLFMDRGVPQRSLIRARPHFVFVRVFFPDERLDAGLGENCGLDALGRS